VKRALEGLEGVTAASVELESGRAIVDYREGTLSDVQAIEAIQDTVVLPGLRRWLALLPGASRSPFNR
jgi:hypothetical protein